MNKSPFTLAEYKAQALSKTNEELNNNPKWFFTPNYKRAALSKSSRLKLDNEYLEKFYFKQMENIKLLIQQLPNEADRLVYERNRKDEYENLECLHDFFSTQIRFNLICDFDFRYKLEYTITESPLKEQLTEIITLARKGLHHLEEIILKPDYTTYYLKAMECRKEFTRVL